MGKVLSKEREKQMIIKDILRELYILRYALPAGVIVYITRHVLLSLRKRNVIKSLIHFKRRKELTDVVLEILLWSSLFAILDITGVINVNNYGGEYCPSIADALISMRYGFFRIPLIGAIQKNVLENIILFMPYGFLFWNVFGEKKWNLGKAVLVGIFTSLIIEVLQAFTWRVTEIDDVIANTAGFAFGLYMAVNIQFVMNKFKLELWTDTSCKPQTI